MVKSVEKIYLMAAEIVVRTLISDGIKFFFLIVLNSDCFIYRGQSLFPSEYMKPFVRVFLRKL